MVGERRAILRAKELELLQMLVREPGHLIRTTTLAKQLAHRHKPLSKTTVAMHIHRPRIRLKSDGLTISSFRSTGYTLERLESDHVE